MPEPMFETQSPQELALAAVEEQTARLLEIAETPLQKAFAQIIQAGSQEVVISEKN